MGKALWVKLRLESAAGVLGDKNTLRSLCWSVEPQSQPWSSCKSCLLLFTLGLKLMLQRAAPSIWTKQAPGFGVDRDTP